MNIKLKVELLEIAKKAALKAGEIQLKYYGKKKDISYKLNPSDLVTNADKEAESEVIKLITEKYPTHSFLAEESKPIETNSEFEWIIDPIDGTVNYAHNFPHFCSSIGLTYKGDLFLGAVYDPIRKELFYASKDDGAYCNEDQIHVSPTESLSGSLLATGFPYDKSTSKLNNLDYFESFTYKSQAIRRPGSAALDLCYVAAGRVDGFWELKLKPWDTAAGALIVLEAGGTITNFHSDKFDIFTSNPVASNGIIQSEMMDVIQQTDSKRLLTGKL